jgi:dihydroflavonol-4-reductase
VKVFLTGGTGFIGKHLAKRLLKEGHHLRCLVRDARRAVDLQALGAELVKGDVNDRAALRAGMQGCDWLFHLANLYSMWEPDPGCFTRVNVEGTCNLMETALEMGIKKVVYVSTAAVFGKPQEIPFSELCLPGPHLFSEYARTKAAACELAWDLYRLHGLPLVVLYPGIVLGAGDQKASGQYIKDIIFHRVPSTIFHHSRVTYVYVGDVVEALLSAAEKPEATGQKYLVGGHVLDGAAYASTISRISGVPLPRLHFPDFLVTAAAHILTGLALLTRCPPGWGLSVDAARTVKEGFVFDGSKAARDLEICYTPIELAISEAVASYQASF